MARTYTKESKPRPAEMQAGASWELYMECRFNSICEMDYLMKYGFVWSEHQKQF